MSQKNPILEDQPSNFNLFITQEKGSSRPNESEDIMRVENRAIQQVDESVLPVKPVADEHMYIKCQKRSTRSRLLDFFEKEMKAGAYKQAKNQHQSDTNTKKVPCIASKKSAMVKRNSLYQKSETEQVKQKINQQVDQMYLDVVDIIMKFKFRCVNNPQHRFTGHVHLNPADYMRLIESDLINSTQQEAQSFDTKSRSQSANITRCDYQKISSDRQLIDLRHSTETSSNTFERRALGNEKLQITQNCNSNDCQKQSDTSALENILTNARKKSEISQGSLNFSNQQEIDVKLKILSSLEKQAVDNSIDKKRDLLTKQTDRRIMPSIDDNFLESSEEHGGETLILKKPQSMPQLENAQQIQSREQQRSVYRTMTHTKNLKKNQCENNQTVEIRQKKMHEQERKLSNLLNTGCLKFQFVCSSNGGVTGKKYSMNVDDISESICKGNAYVNQRKDCVYDCLTIQPEHSIEKTFNNDDNMEVDIVSQSTYNNCLDMEMKTYSSDTDSQAEMDIDESSRSLSENRNEVQIKDNIPPACNDNKMDVEQVFTETNQSELSSFGSVTQAMHGNYMGQLDSVESQEMEVKLRIDSNYQDCSDMEVEATIQLTTNECHKVNTKEITTPASDANNELKVKASPKLFPHLLTKVQNKATVQKKIPSIVTMQPNQGMTNNTIKTRNEKENKPNSITTNEYHALRETSNVLKNVDATEIILIESPPSLQNLISINVKKNVTCTQNYQSEQNLEDMSCKSSQSQLITALKKLQKSIHCCQEILKRHSELLTLRRFLLHLKTLKEDVLKELLHQRCIGVNQDEDLRDDQINSNCPETKPPLTTVECIRPSNVAGNGARQFYLAFEDQSTENSPGKAPQKKKDQDNIESTRYVKSQAGCNQSNKRNHTQTTHKIINNSDYYNQNTKDIEQLEDKLPLWISNQIHEQIIRPNFSQEIRLKKLEHQVNQTWNARFHMHAYVARKQLTFIHKMISDRVKFHSFYSKRDKSVADTVSLKSKAPVLLEMSEQTNEFSVSESSIENRNDRCQLHKYFQKIQVCFRDAAIHLEKLHVILNSLPTFVEWHVVHKSIQLLREHACKVKLIIEEYSQLLQKILIQKLQLLSESVASLHFELRIQNDLHEQSCKLSGLLQKLQTDCGTMRQYIHCENAATSSIYNCPMTPQNVFPSTLKKNRKDKEYKNQIIPQHVPHKKSQCQQNISVKASDILDKKTIQHILDTMKKSCSPSRSYCNSSSCEPHSRSNYNNDENYSTCIKYD